jgi:hypothetical protein
MAFLELLCKLIADGQAAFLSRSQVDRYHIGKRSLGPHLLTVTNMRPPECVTERFGPVVLSCVDRDCDGYLGLYSVQLFLRDVNGIRSYEINSKSMQARERTVADKR